MVVARFTRYTEGMTTDLHHLLSSESRDLAPDEIQKLRTAIDEEIKALEGAMEEMTLQIRSLCRRRAELPAA